MPKKTITRTRQYLRGSVICIYPRSCRDFTIIRKKIENAATMFSLSQETRQQQTLISKLRFSTSCAQDSQWATKRAKKIFPPKHSWTKPQKISH